ncbi:hypothetical protein [Streptomyces sp. NPDC057199]|uniref:hypothetical protein n=1 Tax=Streptomyces sp. NPDC057199 TaxID=3346047 RepID=UPI0036340299
MIKRITLRTRRHTKARNSVVLTLLVALLAIAFLQSPVGTTKAEAAGGNCPGGSSSGLQGWPCPNLRNQNLLDQRSLPVHAYRGDSRAPYTIFSEGFRARGGNNNIVSHVQGDRSGDANYISTSGTLSISTPFARSQGLRNLESAARTRCAQIEALNNQRRGWIANVFPTRCTSSATVSADTYVYEIDTLVARNALYVPDQIRGNANLHNQYAVQNEWAYVHRIPREAIRGVRVYRMTARANGTLIDTRSITFTYSRFLINPNYNPNASAYTPNGDANSHFTYTSNLNIPALPRNPYTRGCSAITMCRGGGS